MSGAGVCKDGCANVMWPWREVIGSDGADSQIYPNLFKSTQIYHVSRSNCLDVWFCVAASINRVWPCKPVSLPQSTLFALASLCRCLNQPCLPVQACVAASINPRRRSVPAAGGGPSAGAPAESMTKTMFGKIDALQTASGQGRCAPCIWAGVFLASGQMCSMHLGRCAPCIWATSLRHGPDAKQDVCERVTHARKVQGRSVGMEKQIEILDLVVPLTIFGTCFSSSHCQSCLAWFKA
eukprot:361177-Chlamydomonas_euryale.AAC.2